MDTQTFLFDLVLANLGWLVPIVAIFTRMSVFIYLLPGLGETVIPQRIRLAAAFLMTWMIVPLLAPTLNTIEPNLIQIVFIIAKEGFYGFLLGFSFRIMIFTLQILGNVVSQALSISQVLGEGIATEPNTTISTLFIMAGITLLVTLDLHVEALRVFYRSYEAFPLGATPDFDSIAYLITHKAMGAFSFAIALALPFVILNFVYNLMIGFLNKAMPQLMVSFVGMPAITGAGLFLMVIATGSILGFWTHSYADGFDGIFQSSLIRNSQ